MTRVSVLRAGRLVMMSCAVLLVVAAPAGAATWHFETLDGHQNGPAGRIIADLGTDTAALVTAGQPHVWYRDYQNDNLRHAWWNGAAWVFETLDGHQNDPSGQVDAEVGFDIGALLYGSAPHLWYHDATSSTLRHAWWNGAAWSFEILDGEGGPNGRNTSDTGWDNAPLLHGGAPHLWYGDASFGNLRHAWWSGSAWFFETLDGHQNGLNGQINASVGIDNRALSMGGQPHVWHRDNDGGNLRHSWWNGLTWSSETLDGAGGPNGRLFADVGWEIAVLELGAAPHVWYWNVTARDLRHGWWTGMTWAFETLDGHQSGPNGQILASVGSETSVALYGGAPHVWYYRETEADLRHGWWTGATWAFETLDGHQSGPNGQILGAVGTDTATVLFGGAPHVFSTGGTDLRHAWYG